MIVTEEMLSSLRPKRGPLDIDQTYRHIQFEYTSKAFSAEWKGADLTDRSVVVILAFTKEIPRLKDGRTWLALNHQSGGYACEQQPMIATRLSPHPSIVDALLQIAKEGHGASHFWRSDVLASRIANYVAALKSAGLDCEATWRYLTESLYPVDATQENLNRIATDAPLLDDIADWTGFIRARYSKNPAIFFMVENSD